MTRRKSWLGVATLACALNLGAATVWSQNLPDILQGQGEAGKHPRPAEQIEPNHSIRGSGAKAEFATPDLKRVQEALKEKGHDPGPIDGVLGPRTKEALKDFQAASGLQATGSLDAETAAKLGLGKSMSFEGGSAN